MLWMESTTMQASAPWLVDVGRIMVEGRLIDGLSASMFVRHAASTF